MKKNDKEKPPPSAPPPPLKKEGGNGKGDSPRNLSSGFRNNYSSINWSKKNLDIQLPLCYTLYLMSLGIKSCQIVYSEHGADECFEHKEENRRVPDGVAIGYECPPAFDPQDGDELILFDDIKYSEYDHKYWDNLELENDSSRLII